MRLYGGIDLHSNNSFTTLIDQNDKAVFEKRMPNELGVVLKGLEPFRDKIAGVVVESTYNWYWLVDGLMDTGYRVHLANTAAIKQYDGLKHTDDKSDARWLAHLLRLGILPEGYIYPKEERSVRDLLRKRMQLVRQRTTNILSIEGQVARHLGSSIRCNQVKRLAEEVVDDFFSDECVSLAVKSNVAVMRCLDERIKQIEREAKKRMELRPEFKQLLTVDGIGEILALTISLETGDIHRFPKAGNYASYCRCVRSERTTNYKKKGQGNTRNGNKYLAWAYVEAAAFAIRWNELARRFYQRKSARTNKVVARKALANKLARACFYIMRDNVPFDEWRAFAA
jgi:transposase